MSLKGLFSRLLYGAGTAEFWQHREKALSAKNALSRRWHRYKYSKIMFRYCASIPDSVKIDGRLTLPHGLNGILISQGAELGSGCTVFQQVTIGSNTLRGAKRPGSPKIGECCYIGAGAKIIGGITIGNNVRIGANCVVTEDVPDNATIVMPKPRVLVRPSPQDNTFEGYKL